MAGTRNLNEIPVQDAGTLTTEEAAQFLCCDPPQSQPPITRRDLEED